MSNETYTQLAATYDRSLAMPYRKYLERFSVLQALGSCHGDAILDVACGTGIYSRELRQRGAAHISGIDVSEAMIAEARRIESREPLDINYRVGDAVALYEMQELGLFDKAIGVYLLHYATSMDHLRSICRGIAARLKVGARFVGWQLSETLSRDPNYYEDYGMRFNGVENLRDGDQYSITIQSNDFLAADIPIYYWSNDAYESALMSAGFGAVTWHAASVAPAGRAELGDGFWAAIGAHPLFAIINAVKA